MVEHWVLLLVTGGYSYVLTSLDYVCEIKARETIMRARPLFDISDDDFISLIDRLFKNVANDKYCFISSLPWFGAYYAGLRFLIRTGTRIYLPVNIYILLLLFGAVFIIGTGVWMAVYTLYFFYNVPKQVPVNANPSRYIISLSLDALAKFFLVCSLFWFVASSFIVIAVVMIWKEIAGLIVVIVVEILGVSIFLVPLYTLHSIMVTEKRTRILNMSVEKEAVMEKILEGRGTAEDLIKLLALINLINEERGSREWPFTLPTLARSAASSSLPIVSYILSVIFGIPLPA